MYIICNLAQFRIQTEAVPLLTVQSSTKGEETFFGTAQGNVNQWWSATQEQKMAVSMAYEKISMFWILFVMLITVL